MATILRAYNDLGVKYDLDVFNEQQFLLDISAIESGDIGKVFGISSQTFALPPTPNNNDFFGNLYDLGAVMPSGSLANPSTAPTTFTKTMPCQVLNDGVSIFNGKLYLDSVITNQEGDTIYNVNVVNETIDFKYLVQDLTFGDLDWSDYNHDYTYTNISQSWDLTLLGGDVVYPLVEYGYDKNDILASELKSGGSVNTFTNATTPLWVNDFKPAVRITTILDKVFDTLNYKYTSSFFESAYADTIYMLATKDAGRGTSFVNPISQSFEANASGNQVLTNFLPTKVQFDNEVYDNAGNYNPATQRFTAGSQGSYSFDVQLSTQISGVSLSSTPRNAVIEMYVNGAYTGIPAVWYNLKGLTNNANKVMTANFANVSLNASDYVEIYITFETEDGSESLTIKGLPNSSYWKCYQGPLTTIGGNVDLRGVFNADESVLDFLNGLIQKFNLVIEPLADNPSVLSIEPFNTWVDNGSVVDWTNKVDRSVKWEIKHPMSGTPRSIYFSDVEDKDDANQYSINAFGKIFGDYKYVSESDLANGERRIGTYFAPTPMKYIVGTTDFIVPQIFNAQEGQKRRVAFKPRLLHYNGLKDAYLSGVNESGTAVQNVWYFKDESGTIHAQTQYPQFHHNNALPAVDGTKDLHFNNPQHWEYHQNYVNARTIHDAVYDYWSFYINEIYDIDARLLTLNVALKPTEIPTIRLNDKIFIDGHYYRINKISGANLTNEQSTKVELIKTLPRKLQYPRRRISIDTIGVGIGYQDVFAGNVNITGGVVYNDFNTDTPITSSVISEQAGYRDGFYVYSGSIQVGSPVHSTPFGNYVRGVNHIDDRVNESIVIGNGNIVGGNINDSIVVGQNNDLSSGIGTLQVFGKNISFSGSVENAFVVNKTGSVSITDTQDIIALNPVRPINGYDNNKVVVGNVLRQGAQYETYNVITASAGFTTYLTGSEAQDRFHYHFTWTGGNGTANVYINDSTNPEYDGLQQRFTTDATLTASNIVNLIPISGTIDGGAEEALNKPYDGMTAEVIDGNWLVIQRKG